MKDLLLREENTCLHVIVFWHEGTLSIAPDLGVVEGPRPEGMTLREWKRTTLEEMYNQILEHQIVGKRGLQHLRRAERLIRNTVVHLKRKYHEEHIKVFLCPSDDRRFKAYLWLAQRMQADIQEVEDGNRIEIVV